MIVFSNQILLAFSLYDLRCIIITIRKQIIAFKKGTFAPPGPQLKGRRGPAPPAPLSGVPADSNLFGFQLLISQSISDLTQNISITNIVAFCLIILNRMTNFQKQAFCVLTPMNSISVAITMLLISDSNSNRVSHHVHRILTKWRSV